MTRAGFEEAKNNIRNADVCLTFDIYGTGRQEEYLRELTATLELGDAVRLPEYCLATPADKRPFLRNPVSSGARTAPSPPSSQTTYRVRASRQASSSHGEKFSSRCSPSGDA